jgi:hypothetical protein
LALASSAAFFLASARAAAAAAFGERVVSVPELAAGAAAGGAEARAVPIFSRDLAMAASPLDFSSSSFFRAATALSRRAKAVLFVPSSIRSLSRMSRARSYSPLSI